MIVRPATIGELPEAFELFTAFESCSKLVKVVPSVCVANYTRFIEQGMGGLLLAMEADEIIGGLGFIIANDLHSGKKYAVETFWLMLKRGNGIKLVEIFEQIARQASCDECAMIHLADSFPDALERVYAHRGYKMIEKHYVKELI